MNRTALIATTTFIALAIGLVGGYWFATQRAGTGTSAQVAAGAPAADDKKPLYYYDPMYPQQKFDKPGKSPFMDMMLVPVYRDDGADSGSVRINARTTQNLGVRIGEVTEGSIANGPQLVGAVAFDERAVALVQARVNGYVERLFVRAPLDPVKSGQPLAEVLAPDWVAAQEEFLALKKSPQANDALRQAARQRLILLGMAETTVAAIEADGKVRPRITLLAPISGVIGELAVREGMAVAPGTMLFRINGLATVWINADVPESQLAGLTVGSAVEASVPAYPGEIFKGRVGALLPEVNSGTRTLKARIEIANSNGHLAPGMFASISVTGAHHADVLLVPSEAVILTGKRNVVIVAAKGGDGAQQFTPTDVEIGAESAGMTEIRRGLSKGTKVVLSGQFMIDSEASLKTSGDRMGAAPAPAETLHKGEGVVEKIGKTSVTLSHGPIASLQMGAMTMDYLVPKTGLPTGIKVGNKVAFDVLMTPQGEFALVHIEPIAAMKSTPPAGIKK
ncbi:MAG: efflux RND transporter periplasmic adaptor subunit [Betaproteobacteria bacterium]|nr:efflux RND transporter periplasmic adaptor subunit [Betaproteobacteria bacterium]